MDKEQVTIVALDAIATKASKFTGRTLAWSIKNETFSLGDKTTLGNLALKVSSDGGVREVYMRVRQFGLKLEDLDIIESALRSQKN